MDGQITLFEYVEGKEPFHSCFNCENAKRTELFRDGKILFCNKTRQCITEKTESWLCDNQHYKRR